MRWHRAGICGKMRSEAWDPNQRGNKMELKTMECPNCGATISFEEGSARAQCEYCGSVFYVDKGNSAPTYEDAAEAGYRFEKGRQKAMEEAAANVPKKRKTWLWVLGWIFCFPIPLSILIGRSNMSKVLKAVLIIAAFGVNFVMLGASSDESTGSSSLSAEKQQTTLSITAAAETSLTIFDEQPY